jgi:hypothetical protein
VEIFVHSDLGSDDPFVYDTLLGASV